jgi:hypothetical protein
VPKHPSWPGGVRPDVKQTMLVVPRNQVTQTEDRAALEGIAHLTQKICGAWGTAELDGFFSRLIMDARDGDRRGLPLKVAAEILFLVTTNKMVRAIDLAKRLDVRVEHAYRLIDEGDQARLKTDAFDDPLVSRDTVTRGHRPAEAPARRPVKVGVGGQARGLGELLMMLVRSKLLAWAITLMLGAKFVWPSVKALI